MGLWGERVRECVILIDVGPLPSTPTSTVLCPFPQSLAWRMCCGSFRFLQIWWVRDAIWLFWPTFFLLTKSSPILLICLSISVCVGGWVWCDLGSFSFGLFIFSPWFVGLLSKLEKRDVWDLRETKAITSSHLCFLLSWYLAKGCREIFSFHDF